MKLPTLIEVIMEGTFESVSSWNDTWLQWHLDSSLLKWEVSAWKEYSLPHTGLLHSEMWGQRCGWMLLRLKSSIFYKACLTHHVNHLLPAFHGPREHEARAALWISSTLMMLPSAPHTREQDLRTRGHIHWYSTQPDETHSHCSDHSLSVDGQPGSYISYVPFLELLTRCFPCVQTSLQSFTFSLWTFM